jgi:hypothetical protein
MDVSPFPYQGPLEPGELRGRDDLVADLVERISEHRVTALLGPRRYGKTSVLRRVAADVVAAGVSAITVDLYEVSSMADLAVRLDAALAAAGATSERMVSLAAAAELNLGAVRLELRRPPASRPDPLATVHTQLDVVTKLAAHTPVLVVFDEFAGIARVNGAAGMLRTHLQHHFQKLGLLFAGSEPALMRMLFTEQAQPFYAQADLVEIGPLGRDAIAALVDDGFRSTGRHAGPVGLRIAAFTGGHPQRAMQLADAAWRLVERGERADDATWTQALAAVRGASGSGLERLYSSLPARERDVLRAIASGGSPFGTAGSLLELGAGAAQHARRSLLDAGHLHAVGQSIALVDPIFADWLRERLPI